MDATLFKSFLETNTINFIIMISILVLIFKKAHLGDVIDKMAEDIRNNVDKSATSTKEAIDEYKLGKAFAEEIPNTTKLIIAQRIASVQDADKIIVMEKGEINGVGTHEELLVSNSIYKEVYESQVKGSDE